ncbi:MAG: hypothetical protein HQL23_00140 [Candidatus Omnitrophica bacterium]|nr:hypothetical protein [Candidatus Omnitrophota bacterium]
MLTGKIRILNLDDSVARQPDLVRRFAPAVIDLRAWGPRLRLWSNDRDAALLRAVLSPESRGDATFLGSGDFHHLSSVLLEQFLEPLTVIVFDHHPDWDIFPPAMGCGSWVTRILKMPNVQKVILLGIASEDISEFSIQAGNLSALDNNRLEIYPYARASTMTLFKKVPLDNPCIRVERGICGAKIYWRELARFNASEIVQLLRERILTDKIYISIDKDCLPGDCSLTNWETGRFPLADLLFLLRTFRKNYDILGLDITGDYSPPLTRGLFKTLVSRFDHPREFSAAGHSIAAIQKINQALNLKILETLTAAV